MPLCDALAVNPPYRETRSLTSTVSGTSTPTLRLDGDDKVASAGKLVDVESACSVAIAVDRVELPKPIESVLAGTVT